MIRTVRDGKLEAARGTAEIRQDGGIDEAHLDAPGEEVFLRIRQQC